MRCYWLAGFAIFCSSKPWTGQILTWPKKVQCNLWLLLISSRRKTFLSHVCVLRCQTEQDHIVFWLLLSPADTIAFVCGSGVSPATGMLSSVCCHPWKLEHCTAKGFHLSGLADLNIYCYCIRIYSLNLNLKTFSKSNTSSPQVTGSLKWSGWWNLSLVSYSFTVNKDSKMWVAKSGELMDLFCIAVMSGWRSGPMDTEVYVATFVCVSLEHDLCCSVVSVQFLYFCFQQLVTSGLSVYVCVCVCRSVLVILKTGVPLLSPNIPIVRLKDTVH